MNNIEKSGKILGIAIALVYLLFFQGNQNFEWILFGTILLTIGIPHGALDHLLLNPMINNKGLVKFIFKYLVIIILYSIIWIFFPIPALLAFIAMSAYHFGQSHFIWTTLTYQKKIIYLLTGVYYLSVIFWGDFNNTAAILNNLINIEPLQHYGLPIIISSLLISIVLINRNNLKNWKILSLEMIVVGILLYHLPLLVAFIIYFGFWHALPSMHEEYLSLKNYFFKNKLKSFIMRMIPFTAVSIGGMIVILALFYSSSEAEELILMFFILVSLISAPHIWYMNLFLESKKS